MNNTKLLALINLIAGGCRINRSDHNVMFIKRIFQMTFDETYISIMIQLRKGRKSYSEIAKSLSITEDTVRARVKKLRDEGIFTITGLVNPSKISG